MQNLREVLEMSAHLYSTPFPCFNEGGMGNLVSPSYQWLDMFLAWLDMFLAWHDLFSAWLDMFPP